MEIYDELVKNKKVQLTEDELKFYMICLRERLRYRESIELSEKLLKMHSNNSVELLNLCICYGKQGEYKRAIEYYEEILKNDSAFEEQLGYYAYLLYQNNKLEESKKVYEIAIKKEPNNSWYISHYALLLEKLGQYSEAIKYFKKAMDLDQNNTWLIKTFIFLYGKLEGTKKAYKYYLDLIKNNKDNFNLYINYAEYAILNNDIDYAKNILEKIEVEKMSIALQVIYYIYSCFIDLYNDQKDDFEINKVLFLQKRQQYNGYIHRDFTLLNKFAEEKFTKENNYLYHQILQNLKERR